jgi:hypothetical protein
MVLGFIYYHEKVFGKAWMESLGMTKADAMKTNMAVLFGTSFAMSVLLAWYILYDVDGPGQEDVFDSFKHGAFHGLLLGVLVAMPVMITNGLFERKKWKTMLINVGYWIICMVLMAGVLDAMNHSPFGETM